MTKEDALVRLQRYCDYQDRCHQDVRTKLLSLKVYGEALEWVIDNLIQEGYLNETRFACNFARGKFRIKGWGRMRILNALRAKHISEYNCNKAMLEIEDDAYRERLSQLLQSQVEKLDPDITVPVRRQQLTSWAMRKGYETEIIQSVLAELS